MNPGHSCDKNFAFVSEQHQTAIALVDKVYENFTRYNDDLYDYARNHRLDDRLIAKLY